MSKKPLERRIAHAPVELRRVGDVPVVRGYAAVYDSEAHGEVIRRGAFDRTISQRDDIRLLVNHDGVPLARTKSGTLTIGTDDIGLWFEAQLDVNGSQTARDLVSALERGDIDQCSFAGYFSDRTVDGVREVFEVKAVDVSIVTYPWYEETSVGMTGDRGADLALMCLRSLTPEQREMTMDALERETSITINVADASSETETETGMGEQPTCPDCGADMSADANYCAMCGAPSRSVEPVADERQGMSTADARALLASFAA